MKLSTQYSAGQKKPGIGAAFMMYIISEHGQASIMYQKGMSVEIET